MLRKARCIFAKITRLEIRDIKPPFQVGIGNGIHVYIYCANDLVANSDGEEYYRGKDSWIFSEENEVLQNEEEEKS